MKNASQCSEKLAELRGRLPEAGAPPFAHADDPVAVLILSFLMWESTTDMALAAFEELKKSGQVAIGAKNLVGLPPMPGRLIGTFRANPRGFGFVRPLQNTSHGDLYIPPKAVNGAMTGDTVMAHVVKKYKHAGQMR